MWGMCGMCMGLVCVAHHFAISYFAFRMQAVGAARTRNGRGQVAAGCLAKKGDNAKNCAIDWREPCEGQDQKRLVLVNPGKC